MSEERTCPICKSQLEGGTWCPSCKHYNDNKPVAKTQRLVHKVIKLDEIEQWPEWTIVRTFVQRVYEKISLTKPIIVETAGMSQYNSAACKYEYGPSTKTVQHYTHEKVVQVEREYALISCEAEVVDVEQTLRNQLHDRDRVVEKLKEEQRDYGEKNKELQTQIDNAQKRIVDLMGSCDRAVKRADDSEKVKAEYTEAIFQRDKTLAEIKKVIGERAYNEIVKPPAVEGESATAQRFKQIEPYEEKRP